MNLEEGALSPAQSSESSVSGIPSKNTLKSDLVRYSNLFRSKSVPSVHKCRVWALQIQFYITFCNVHLFQYGQMLIEFTRDEDPDPTCNNGLIKLFSF